MPINLPVLVVFFSLAHAVVAAPNCDQWSTDGYFKTATLEDVKACLEAGADPNARDWKKGTPLHWAAFDANATIIQALLKAGADPNAQDKDKDTPLHQAAQYSKTPGVIEALLEAGADPNAQAADDVTPLHSAAKNGNLVAIQALLDAGADVKARTNWGSVTPLHLAAENGNLSAIRVLLAAGADVDVAFKGGVTPLWIAVGDGNVELIKVLLAAGADPMFWVWGGDSAKTPLDLAHFGEEFELLQAAVKTAGQDCSLWNTKRHFQGATPESVTTCLGAGSNPREKDVAGITPLHRAASYNGNPAVSQILIDAGADVEARDVKGFTPLRWAVNQAYWDPGGNESLAAIRTLLDVGADPDAQDEDGDTVLHVAIREVTRAYNRQNRGSHYPAVIQMLLDAGADPEARDRIGNRPLHETAGDRESPLVVTEALLKAGANPKTKDERGRTPLHMAAGYHFNPEVIKALLSAGADLEARESKGRTPLHMAAGESSHQWVAQALLTAGADVEARDDEGRTPLHVAAAERQRAVEILLEAGADLQALDEDGDTPLHRVAAYTHSRDDRDLVAAVMALLSAGANPLARNGEGKTPWDLAQANEKLKGSVAYMWLRAARSEVPGGGAASAFGGGSARNAVVPATGDGLADASGEQRAQRQAREGLPNQPEMVRIPGGSFRMGCVSGDGCFNSERPVHAVRVESFELGKYEVTFEEYDRFTAATGRERAADMGWGRGHHPVMGVTWEDAVAYTQWLSKQTGGQYRLPTEAEWEYAARAGSVTAYGWRNGDYRNQANCGGYCGSQWGDRGTAPVGSFTPNGWGLHDMHGNVWEWVQDCWNRNYRGAPADGTAWESGDCSRRVMRGGSWADYPRYLRSASRYWYSTWIRSNITGFRVARTITP